MCILHVYSRVVELIYTHGADGLLIYTCGADGFGVCIIYEHGTGYGKLVGVDGLYIVGLNVGYIVGLKLLYG